MMRRIILLTAALSMTACAHHMNIDRSELDAARSAIAAAKAANAEKCAPKLQAEAVAALYWAAHELTETDYHPDENAELTAEAESKAKEAQRQAIERCSVKEVEKVKVIAPLEVIHLDGVYFDTGSADLKAGSTTTLDEAVATLKRRNDIHVEVAAHTDSRGSTADNQALSNNRAASVKSYLVSHGIDASRLSSKGYGESQPIASNTTTEGQTKNRRVELRVLIH